MKARRIPQFFHALICLPILLTPSLLLGKSSFLNYKFTRGTTNVYKVKIVVQGENGQQVTSGNLFIVTTEVLSNTATLNSRTDLRTESKPAFQPVMAWGGVMFGMPENPNGSEMKVDANGHVLRSNADYPLPVPLGELMRSLFEPLPAKPSGREIQDEVVVEDAPVLQGPTTSQSAFRPYMSFDQRFSQATLSANRQVKWLEPVKTTETITFKKQTVLQSFLQTETEPRLRASAETTLEFNLKDGWLQKIEAIGELSSITEKTSNKSKIHFVCERLTGDELTAVLAPPAPPQPSALSAEDLQKIVADLKSENVYTRQDALNRLGSATIDSPSPELMNLVATVAPSSESYPRQQGVNFLAAHATKEQVPLLLKLLRDLDFSVRQNALKSLARLKDERAIDPLVDFVARGGSYLSEAQTALISFGPSAEKSVLTLLNERQIETRRLACAILAQIGTTDSVEALQKTVADYDASLSQAAADALRAIKARQ